MPDEMDSWAGFGPLAVVRRPCITGSAPVTKLV